MTRRKALRIIKWTVVLLLIFLNAIAAMHAYKLTHFTEGATESTDPRELSLGGKIQAAFTGIDSPRPKLVKLPSRLYKTINLQSNKKLECWLMQTDSAKGTVVIFHGYKGEKSSMLDKAEEFLNMGYNALLVDFMGAGGSEGNQTTIGYLEAKNVKTCYDYLQQQGEQNIYLFGTSMGAAAVMKCTHDYDIKPRALILECPFGTMYETVVIRFKMAGLPSFPMADLFLFWGGVENGFWAFNHNPVDYAATITCPVLLLYGEQDDRVTRGEIDRIFHNLAGMKQLRTFPNAGHENYLKKYHHKWTMNVAGFLKDVSER